jgi:hypothetical protein
MLSPELQTALDEYLAAKEKLKKVFEEEIQWWDTSDEANNIRKEIYG